jgi:hypothetical protein
MIPERHMKSFSVDFENDGAIDPGYPPKMQPAIVTSTVNSSEGSSSQTTQ